MSGKAASNSRTRLQSTGRARHVVPDRRRPRVGPTAGLRRVIGREPGYNHVDFIAKVTDDFPEAIPVIPRELDVLETYLGAFLDAALGAIATKDTPSPEDSTNVP